MSETLDLSNVISVSVLGAPTGLGLPNINTAALFSTETPVNNWSGLTYKVYTSSSAVGTDFGVTSKAFGIAAAFFGQLPNPLTTNGYLVIITLNASETVQAAILRTISLVYYFGILVDTLLSSGFPALATYVQSLDKLLFYGSSTAGDLTGSGLFPTITSASESHTRGFFYSDSTQLINAVAAYAGRALSTNFQGSRTTSTMHLKTLAGIPADPGMNQTLLTQAQTAGADVYPSIAGLSGVFCSGANVFFDEIYNELWLKAALQTEGFNYLRQTNSKVPQTETGMEGLKSAYRKVCAQAVSNGYAAPGSWTSPDTFGDPETLVRCIKDQGYYVYSLPLSQQLQSQRAARQAPLVQIAIKAAGAVHSSNVIVEVNP